MIEVAHTPSTIVDSTAAAATMSGAEEWPSLEAAAANPSKSPTNNSSSGAVGEDWEMLSPSSTDHGTSDNGEENVVAIPHPLALNRQGSISAPDLCILGQEGGAAREGEEDSSAVLVPNHNAGESVASSSVVIVPLPTGAGSNSNPWLNKNKVSFRDAILTPSKYVPPNKLTHNNAAAPPRVRNKVKSRYVVAPIKRCAKSTGDLLSLLDEEEILGESDAQEYYQRKSHGAHGRDNGLKKRPDEAKRKDMIVQKKNLQRQKQGK